MFKRLVNTGLAQSVNAGSTQVWGGWRTVGGPLAGGNE
jgi:hypothetical protein